MVDEGTTEEFQKWVESEEGQQSTQYHYSLADSVGISSIKEYGDMFIELVAAGFPPKLAGPQALSLLVSMCFQLGYDYAKSGAELHPCKCERKNRNEMLLDLVKDQPTEMQEPPDVFPANDFPGNYL